MADAVGRSLAKPRPSSLASGFQRGAAWSVSIFMFVPGEEEPRVGSGFFIDDRGSIATAAHLLGETQQILVALPDRRVVAAEVEGADPNADIALLRVAAPPPVRPVFARSGGVRVGDWVMAQSHATAAPSRGSRIAPDRKQGVGRHADRVDTATSSSRPRES